MSNMCCLSISRLLFTIYISALIYKNTSQCTKTLCAELRQEIYFFAGFRATGKSYRPGDHLYDFRTTVSARFPLRGEWQMTLQLSTRSRSAIPRVWLPSHLCYWCAPEQGHSIWWRSRNTEVPFSSRELTLRTWTSVTGTRCRIQASAHPKIWY